MRVKRILDKTFEVGDKVYMKMTCDYCSAGWVEITGKDDHGVTLEDGRHLKYGTEVFGKAVIY